jgi:hypothetical protein
MDMIRIAQPRPGHFVFVLPVLLTAEERKQAEEAAHVDKLAVPETKAAYVVAQKDGSKPNVELVADMLPPRWEKNTSPGRAISVVWQSNDEIWIGIAGERGIAGGLWHSPDGGTRWKKVEGFISVTSLGLIASPSGKETLLVAEESLKHVISSSNVPSAARLVERADGDRWVPIDALPYGSNSEIEICGTLADGTLNVRVDGTIYQKRSRSLLRSVLDGL